MTRYGQYTVPLVKQCVNFKVGQPAPSLLPLKLIRESSILKFKEKDPLLLQYGDIPGYKDFRESLAEFLTNNYKRTVDPDHLFVTSGVSSTLSLLCTLFLKPGDTVFVENPTYFLASRIFQDHRINCIGINMDQDGMNMQDFREKLKSHNPKLLYIIPTAHNPTGRTTSFAKRLELIEISETHGFKIIADEVYQMLTFPHIDPPASMCSRGSKKVISMGSFSKILAPALRLGWMEIPCNSTYKKIQDCGQLDSSGGMNPVISAMVHVLLDNGQQQEHLDSVRQILWNRAETLIAAIDKHLVPLGCKYEVPQGGYFVFVRLPYKIEKQSDIDYLEFEDNWIRLSFSYYDKEDLEEGIKRLAKYL